MAFHLTAMGVTCCMEIYLTQENTPTLTPARHANTRFTYRGGMKG